MLPTTSAFRCAVLLVLAMLVAAPAARAHRVTVFGWVDGDTVHTESKFSGGRRAQGAPIEVYDDRGRRLLGGETDENGAFSFEIPGPTALRIVLAAGMGHQAEWRIEEAEVRAGLAAAGVAPAAPDSPPVQAPTAGETLAARTEPERAPRAAAALDAGAVREIVDRALDRKLQPVLALLARERDPAPDLRDVVGALGYILGLVGLAAYLHARRLGRGGDQ